MSSDLYEQIALYIWDTITERKVCAVSGQDFAVFQKDREFLDTISPTFAWQKFVIPNPTLCPEERQARRLMQRNERNYYKSTCALTGKAIVTNINPKLWEPVYDSKARRWDGRDARDCLQDRDPTQSFLTQFHTLKKRVPKIALMNDNGISSENCLYTYDILYCKDCYMTMEAINDKLAHYCLCVHRSENMVDCTIVYDSHYCIECTDSYKLYSCVYAHNCNECNNMLFARDCKWCSDCLCCVGLRNRQYCIFNRQYSKEEYISQKEAIIQKHIQDKDKFLHDWNDFLSQQQKLFANLINSESSIGNNIFDSSDIAFGFEISNCKKSRYMYNVLDSNNAMDIDISTNVDHCYDCMTPDLCRKTCFSLFCSSCNDVRYSEMCHRCTDCFGCVWLKDKQYCILNKQYTKEEYELMVAKIISQMIVQGERWEYFPAWTSTHPYNKSDAMQRYPLTKEQALSRWYARDDEIVAVNIPEHATTISWSDLDTNPLTVSDTIIDSVIVCPETKRPFRIIKQELELYRKMKFPLPRLHHDLRHQQRMARRLGRKLYLRSCPSTWTKLITPYSPAYQGRVVSKEAYEKEIYG